MPDKMIIKELTDGTDPAWEEVENLFQEMYQFMTEHGLQLPLSENGSSQWLASVKKGLGRFGIVFVCVHEDEIIGFSHGSIRLSPDYLGNKKMGVITHVHVKDAYRKNKSGTALVKALEGWFEKQQVHSVELQVLSANNSAISFWEKLGYDQELIQYRRIRGDR